MYVSPVAPRPGSPFCHVTSCNELTINVTDWPTGILRFVGVKAKPLVVTVLAGATVVDVVGALVVVVVVVTGLAVVVSVGVSSVIVLVDVFAG